MEQERRRLAKKAEDAALLRKKTEEIEQKVADSGIRLAQRKLHQVFKHHIPFSEHELDRF